MGLTLPNGVVQNNRHDPAGRLLERSYTAGETLLGRYEYQLNELGQTVYITETVLTPELIQTIEIYQAQSGVLNLALSNGVLTPTAELPISLPSGEYTVWAHAWDEGSTSPTTTLPLALDNGAAVLTTTLTNFPTSGWAWTTGGSTTLTADGAYTLTAGLVGDGVQVDRLLLADNSLYDPQVSQPELTAPTIITQLIPSELITQTIALSYDGLNRVTQAQYNGAYTSIFGYEYNALGSRLTYTAGVTVTTYNYNAADYLLQSVTGNVTSTYSWNAAGQLITTTVGGQPTAVYTYDQRGNLTVAVTNGLTTTFVYNGHNQRLQLSVNGQPTTYLLDYARGGNRVLQESSALETKFYLYGDTCLAELVETDDPEQPEQRYYLYDGSQTVRQTVNEQAQPTYAWTFSPEGAVLLGEEGPVSHLSCVGDAVYDWSTGLIFKGGKYYDPRSDLWLTFGSPAVVWAVNRLGGKPDKRKDKKQNKRFFWLLFLLLVLFVLAGCANEGTPTPPRPSTATPEITVCPTPSATSTPISTPSSTPTLPPPMLSTVLPTNTPTQQPTQTPLPTLTPTVDQHPWTRFKLSNPFGTKSYLIVNPYGSNSGLSRPETGSTGHYGIDLVTEEYVNASHSDKEKQYVEDNITYYFPSTVGTTVFAPATGQITRNDGETIIIEADSVKGVEVELTHIQTGVGVINNGVLETNYSNGLTPYGSRAIHPHLHLTVTFTNDRGEKRDLDPRSMLPVNGLLFFAGNANDVGVYYNDGGRTGIHDLPKYPTP